MTSNEISLGGLNTGQAPVVNKNKINNAMEIDIPKTQRVLILGAGMIAAPVVEYFRRFKTIAINVCSHLIDECDSLAIQYPGIISTCLNVKQDTDSLKRLLVEHDVVISLLPYALHGLIAEHCIGVGTHMVTASYLTDELRHLNER